MKIHDIEQKLVEDGRGAAEWARIEVSDGLGHVPEIAGEARFRAGQVAHTLPGAFDHARLGAESTVTRLQTLSDSRLRLLAAVSLGFGAGLRLAGKQRLAALVGLAAASLFGFAILSRPQSANPEPRPMQP
jgi:hypothetical protein